LYSKETFYFKSPVQTDFKNNDIAYGYIVRRKETSRNLVIFIHGLRARDCDPWGNIGYHFVKKNFDILFLRLPFHGKRAPDFKPKGEYFLQVNPLKQLMHFEQAVLEIKVLTDYFGNDYDGVYIMGNSLGAMISEIVMAMDKRVKKGVFINLGGGLYEITWKGMGLAFFRREHYKEGVTPKKCIKTRSYYPDFLKEVRRCKAIDEIWDIKIDGEKCFPHNGFPIPSECYYADPLTYAPFLKGREMLLINSLFDFAIHRICKTRIWNELGKPEVIRLPCTHITSGLFKNSILSYATSFFNRLGKYRTT
jgi:pimeloyl-ACP methyl ester carboxylesterase